jgi:hypothetical protein
MLGRRPFSHGLPHQFDSAHRGIRAIPGHSQPWLPILIAILHIFNGVTQGTGGAFVHGLDDSLNFGCVWIDPRLGTEFEYGREAIGAETRVRTGATVIVNGDPPANVIVSSVRLSVSFLLVRETVRQMSTAAKRSISRPSTSA